MGQGTVYKLIQEIVEKSSKGEKVNGNFVKIKIMTSLGINIDDYTPKTTDKEETINDLRDFANELGIQLTN